MIRKAEPADVGNVAVLERACFDDPYEPSFLVRACTDPAYAFLLSEQDGELIGYVLAQRSDAYELMRVAVAKKARRTGVGRELMNRFSDRAVVLEVAASNDEAMAFYERCGFSLARIRKDYYGVGKDAIVCVRPPL